MNSLYPPVCDGCRGKLNSKGYCPPDDPTGKKLVVYGETPGQEEVGLAGFVGRSGRLLRACEQRAGLHSPMPRLEEGKASSLDGGGEVAHLNVICCRPPENKWPGDKLAVECMGRHADMHARSLAGNVLVCGANATRVLTGWVEEITETRGTLLRTPQGKWLVSTLHPAFLLHGEDENGKSQDHLRPLIIFDIMKAKRGDQPRFPKWIEITTGTKLLEILRREKPSLVSIDMEGDGYVGVGWEEEVYGCWWDETVATAVKWVFENSLPVFHNATYDLDQITSHGLPVPDLWVDTIVMAGILDPCVPLNLQAQVLSHVPGTVAWKGLVNFRSIDAVDLRVERYVKLWKEVLGECLYVFPNIDSPQGRLAIYNALDVWGTWHLAHSLKERLGSQMDYYRTMHQPLQKMLYELGKSGMPVDPKRMEEHRLEIAAKEAKAKAVLKKIGQEMLEINAGKVKEEVDRLLVERQNEYEAAGKKVKFSKAAELTKLRTRLKTRNIAAEGGLNVDSAPQRKALLKGWFGLKLPTHRQTKKETTDEKALERLLEQVRTGRVKVRRGTLEEAEAALSALVEGKKWATWRRNYLTIREENDEVAVRRADGEDRVRRANAGVGRGDDERDQDGLPDDRGAEDDTGSLGETV